MLEGDLLGELRGVFGGGGDSVVVGCGPDDCAHVISPGVRLAFSTDAFAEGTHFLGGDLPEDIAWKALGASLSDLAASGCRPLWALVALSLKRDIGEDWARRFSESMAALAERYGVRVVGGDTTSSSGRTFVATTVAGVPLAGGPVLRSGARSGDVLVVTGRLGGSLLGRHLRPIPRVREMAALMGFCVERGLGVPTACLDVSDGLGLDLSRLCRESGVGAEVEAGLVPVSEAAVEFAAVRGDGTPFHHAMTDGEDFELLMTLPPATWEAWDREQESFGCVNEEAGGGKLFARIGGIIAERELRLIDESGAAQPLEAEGYEHQW